MAFLVKDAEDFIRSKKYCDQLLAERIKQNQKSSMRLTRESIIRRLPLVCLYKSTH